MLCWVGLVEVCGLVGKLDSKQIFLEIETGEWLSASSYDTETKERIEKLRKALDHLINHLQKKS